MSDLSPAPAALASPAGERWLPGPKPPDEGWTRKKFLLVLLFAFAGHVALVFMLGTRQPILPRPVTNVPRLRLANNANEFLALGDPTLFARPNPHDLVTAYWRRLPTATPPTFEWPAPAGYLTNASATLGLQFLDFMRNLHPAEAPLRFKPEPSATPPEVAAISAPLRTTWQITGDLAGRPVIAGSLAPPPSIPGADVIGPSTVQLLVDTAGNVASAVVLAPNTNPEADQLALQLVRNLRFLPAPRLAFGEITFTWHTVPRTNE
jgi:TonB family protein